MNGIGPISGWVGASVDGGVGPFDPRMATAATGGAANYAYGNAFIAEKTIPISKVRFMVVAQNGNIDVGLYAADGVTLLASTGATALGAAGAQEIALTATVAIVAGRKYFAYTSFSGTGTIGSLSATPANLAGTLAQRFSQAGNSHPLPNPLTLAATLGSGRSHVIRFLP